MFSSLPPKAICALMSARFRRTMLRSRYLGSAEADGSLHSVFEVLVREQFTNPHIRAAHRFFPPFSQQHRNHIRGLMHWSDRPAS